MRERADCELVASARVGALPGGRPALHRPDLALIGPAGRVLAVRVNYPGRGRRPATAPADGKGSRKDLAQRRSLVRSATAAPSLFHII
ncbi:MAG: hypothetical protein ACRDLF_04255 [Solirubrobacteraceae bacterium]